MVFGCCSQDIQFIILGTPGYQLTWCTDFGKLAAHLSIFTFSLPFLQRGFELHSLLLSLLMHTRVLQGYMAIGHRKHLTLLLLTLLLLLLSVILLGHVLLLLYQSMYLILGKCMWLVINHNYMPLFLGLLMLLLMWMRVLSLLHCQLTSHRFLLGGNLSLLRLLHFLSLL